MKKILLTLYALIILSSRAQASWVDDYFGSAVSTNPVTYQSQQRGYYSMGGFTARVPHKAEPLMTVSMPSIQTGCGGIDMFWGGISFLNADYLVKKAEGILKNAPYVIFSLGLQALSTSFADTLNNVQAITDQLNQLSLDECSAAKGMVTYAMDFAQDPVGEYNKIKTTGTKILDGDFKDFNKAKKKVNEDPNKAKKEIINKKITDSKAKELLTGSGYVLAKIVGWGNMTESEANAIRAIIGDIYYENDNKDYPDGRVDIKTGCESTMTLTEYTNKPTPYQKSGADKCEYSSISIQTRATDTLESIYSGMTDESSRKIKFDQALIEFINRSNLPIFAYMASISVSGAEFTESNIAILADAVAGGYSYGSLKNLSSNVSQIIKSLRDQMAKQGYYTETLVKTLQKYNDDIQKRINGFESDYAMTLNQLNINFELITKFQNTAAALYEAQNSSYLVNGK